MVIPANQRPGYTVIEISIAILIMATLFAFVYANYKRSNQDSVLQRETSLMISRFRLAQEQTAAGKTLGWCSTHTYDYVCRASETCLGDTCNKFTTPYGGFGMLFSCNPDASFSTEGPVGEKVYTNRWPDQGSYFLFGDRFQCQKNCAPFVWYDVANNGGGYLRNYDEWSDGLYTSDLVVYPNEYKGDTLQTRHTIDSLVEVRDLRISDELASGPRSYTCATGSAWRNLLAPWPQSASGDPLVAAKYPLQIAITFLAPDGRTVQITDNVVAGSPSQTIVSPRPTASSWVKAEIMLGIKNRNNGCKVVTIIPSGAIASHSSPQCNFSE